MATAKLTCEHCKKTALVNPARKSFSQVIIAAYDLGWKRRSGEWFCGAECIKSHPPVGGDLMKQSD